MNKELKQYIDEQMKDCPLSEQQEEALLKAFEKYLDEQELVLPQADVSGSASDFERELYKLINAYVSAGLKKPDLVHKMEYVTQSCRVS